MSNDRIKETSYLGLMEGYRSFLNSYGTKLFKYPKALIRNLVGYQVYSIVNQKKFGEMNKGLIHFKFLSFLLYPFTLIYYKLK